jgi:neutral trehalase
MRSDNPAGDRFRETYYWDSYWVLRGLLVSGMAETASGLVGNLMSMLEAVGHVPNGARVYYLNRRYAGLLFVVLNLLSWWFWVLVFTVLCHAHKCGTAETASGLVGNLMSMLEAVGHVPNGARVYYLNRRCAFFPLRAAFVSTQAVLRVAEACDGAF